MVAFAPRFCGGVRGPGLARHGFSLVELLVAMTILVLLMAVMFKVVIDVQRIWRQQRVRSEVYRNAKLVFDVLSRDLQGLTASTDQGIAWGVDVDAGTVSYPVALISSSGIGASPSDSQELVEVGYWRSATDSQLLRYCSNSNDTDYFSYYGTGNTTWATDTGFKSFEVLSSGVYSFSIVAHDQAGDAVTPPYDSTVAPAWFEVQLELCDPATVGLSDTSYELSLRRFSKRIYTGGSLLNN